MKNFTPLEILIRYRHRNLYAFWWTIVKSTAHSMSKIIVEIFLALQSYCSCLSVVLLSHDSRSTLIRRMADKNLDGSVDQLITKQFILFI